MMRKQLIFRNSKSKIKTYPLAILVLSDLVMIFKSGLTWVAQAANGFGEPSTSTKHILQLPATESRSW